MSAKTKSKQKRIFGRAMTVRSSTAVVWMFFSFVSDTHSLNKHCLALSSATYADSKDTD